MRGGFLSPKDSRGKHLNYPHAIWKEVRQSILDHIASFPYQESHYSQKNPLSYVSALCSVWEKSTASIQKNILRRQSRNIYMGETFQNDFNLWFGLSRSETCKECDKLFVQLTASDTDEKRKEIYNKSTMHHARADQAYSVLKEDTVIATINQNIIILCVDMQQVLFCPTLTHSSMFYQRQLSFYNFAIHNTGNNMLHESMEWVITRKESAEITSDFWSTSLTDIHSLNKGRKAGPTAV